MASSRSSGLVTANKILFQGVNRINALTVITDGTNAATVDLMDGITSGDVIMVEGKCPGADLARHFVFENPVYMENGIYISITGTGAKAIVYYAG